MSRLIVVTTDFSPLSERPFAGVAELASRLGARITLLHVVEDLPSIPHGAPMALPQQQPGIETRRAAAATKIAEVAAHFPPDTKVAVAVEVGAEIGPTVANFAEVRGADLIALASHGRSGLRRLMLGSVAEQILRHATRPVLIYPPPAKDAGKA